MGIARGIANIEKLKKKGDVEGLIEALTKKEQDIDIRSAVARALGEVGDKRAAKPLRKIWAHREGAGADAGEARRETSAFRLDVALALAKIDKRACVDSLSAKTKRKNPGAAEVARLDERLDAIEALDKIGDERAFEPLITCLDDDDDLIRAVASRVLGELGDKRAIRPLMRCMRRSNHYWDKFAYEAAEEAIEKIQKKRR